MKATKSTIENKAFVAHEEDRALEQKYQTPDNFWCDWFEKGYREAEAEAEERHEKETGAIKEKAIEVYKRNCRTYTVCCFEKKPCTADCEYLSDFIEKLNER